MQRFMAWHSLHWPALPLAHCRCQRRLASMVRAFALDAGPCPLTSSRCADAWTLPVAAGRWCTAASCSTQRGRPSGEGHQARHGAAQRGQRQRCTASVEAPALTATHAAPASLGGRDGGRGDVIALLRERGLLQDVAGGEGELAAAAAAGPLAVPPAPARPPPAYHTCAAHWPV